MEVMAFHFSCALSAILSFPLPFWRLGQDVVSDFFGSWSTLYFPSWIKPKSQYCLTITHKVYRDTTMFFSAIFAKGNNIRDFLFAFAGG